MNPETRGLEPDDVWFFVLAGGKSRRLGKNKALIEIEGTPLIQRLVQAIPGKRIAILANEAEPYRFLGLPVIPDVHRGVGPMAGLHAGLRHSDTEYSFFLACDLPRLDTETILAVLRAHRGEDFVGPQTERGIEPLCALYSRSLLPKIEAAIAAGTYGLQEFVAALSNKRLLRFQDETVFYNLNTPEDLNNLESRL
jgi:molybdopterin-guanine dinucleotide biosynthesis protein A